MEQSVQYLTQKTTSKENQIILWLINNVPNCTERSWDPCSQIPPTWRENCASQTVEPHRYRTSCFCTSVQHRTLIKHPVGTNLRRQLKGNSPGEYNMRYVWYTKGRSCSVWCSTKVWILSARLWDQHYSKENQVAELPHTDLHQRHWNVGRVYWLAAAAAWWCGG